MGNKSSTKEEPMANPADCDLDLDDEDAPQTPEQKSYWQMMKQGYQELINAIIRPPRCNYTAANLGPAQFTFCGKDFIRTDFELRNPRGLKIVCSLWGPAEHTRHNPELPCVIYMHGNSSARLEGIPQLALVLSLGATLLAFDFCGSGLSEGEYVSLGAFEKDDLKAVIEHLRSTGTTSTIALWGRSMGAATALLHGERDPSLAGMVLDSSFADLTMLAEEMVERGRKHGLFAPSIIVKIAIRFIRSSVLKTAGFDIKTLSPIERADKCFIPALFVAAEGDEFVPPHHSHKIFNKYAGDKNVVIVSGDHNSPRPKYLQDSVSIFLAHTLQIPDEWILPEGQAMAGLPPWQLRGQKKKQTLATDYKDEEVGMSVERQAEVRAKLYRMLGDNGQVASTAATRTRTPAAPSSSAAASRAATATAAPEGEGEGEAGEEPLGGDLYDEGEFILDEVDDEYYGDDAIDGQEIHLQAMDEDWECAVCTLLNAPMTLTCNACGEHRTDLD